MRSTKAMRGFRAKQWSDQCNLLGYCSTSYEMEPQFPPKLGTKSKRTFIGLPGYLGPSSISLNCHSQAFSMSTESQEVNPAGDSDSSPVNGRTYQDAIKTLNSLQSNLEIVKLIAANKRLMQEDCIPGTVRYLEKTGISLDELDRLNVIHVAGTKGKGSTCAFVESMLRHAGLKTGFYSSPHLVSVRERIRINGKPISEEKFAQYFFESYEPMFQKKVTQNDMPSYFRFLTCMAYRVFLKEKVDVAVMEVGIGGTYDPTNIVRRPVVVGITSLGIDHQAILGDTVEEIAEQKAGIMKENVPAFTVQDLNSSVWEVLKACADSAKCTIYQAPTIDDYAGVEEISYGIDNLTITKLNASLALQLVNSFMQQKFPDKLQRSTRNGGNLLLLQPWHLHGLKNCRWPGRFQTIAFSDRANLVLHLDGAHTKESFQASVKWFNSCTLPEAVKVLVFHVTGFRQAKDLLAPFVLSGLFDKVICCPVMAKSVSTADNWSKLESDTDLRSRCEAHAEAWRQLYHEVYGIESKGPVPIVCDSVEDVIAHAKLESVDHGDKKYHVLVTGSLHLVGTFLSVLDPEL